MYIIKKILLSIIVVTMIFSSVIDTQILYGKWDIEKIENSETNTVTEGTRFLEFRKGGVLEAGLLNGKAEKFGKWVYNAEEKIITISSANGETSSEDGDYFIISLTKRELVLKKEKIKIYFFKH